MNYPHERRVVITGLGVIAANGQDLKTFWESIRSGNSAVVPVSRFPTEKTPTRIAAEIKDFDPSPYIDRKQARRFETSILYGMSAAIQSLRDAGLNMGMMNPERAGVVEATSIGGMESTLKAQVAFLAKGWRGMSPFTFINAYCGGGSGEIALALGTKGPAITYCSGSASGNDGIGYALNLIRSDEADVMVAGGAEAPLLEVFWNGFCVPRVMTSQNDTPKEAMKPFDRRRDGLALGEGAGFVVLEELSHALGRGAKIYAELLGHGRHCEAHHSVAPHPEGLGMARAMEKALRDARAHHSSVNYINAHGTATETNDVAETRAIKKVFGSDARRVAISSTKPITGHLLGAAGAIETIVCALAIKHQEMPLTLNFKEPAEDCDLDYIPNISRPYPIDIALNLNCGFGGKNSCLVLQRYGNRG